MRKIEGDALDIVNYKLCKEGFVEYYERVIVDWGNGRIWQEVPSFLQFA